MPQTEQVRSALRFLSRNPNVPAKGLRYIGRKLQETEESPGETQNLLRSAYHYLGKRRMLKPEHPMMRNIRRLNKVVGDQNGRT